jgi:hypothetical protein
LYLVCGCSFIGACVSFLGADDCDSYLYQYCPVKHFAFSRKDLSTRWKLASFVYNEEHLITMGLSANNNYHDEEGVRRKKTTKSRRSSRRN